MKFSKLLLKLGLKSTDKNQQEESSKKEVLKTQESLENSKSSEQFAKKEYPESIFELIKRHGNEVEAQELIIEKLEELDEVARGYALDSLMDCFGEDTETISLLNKYLSKLPLEDKIWTLRDFAFHHGDMETIRKLIGGHISSLSEEDKYYILTDLTVHHGSDIDVQNLIVKHIDELNNQHKYDVLYCLSHLHGLNQNVQSLILSNLKDLTEAQIKEIFRGLVPNVANKVVSDHLDSLSEKNRDFLVKNASKNKENNMPKQKPKELKKEKLDKEQKQDKLEKVEIVLLDLSNVKKSKNYMGEEAFDIHFSNPVKIYPYVEEKNEDTQIGDAFLTVKDNKIYATVTLTPQLRYMVKKMSQRKPIYKPSGNLAIYKGEAKHMSVDFIYMVF